MTDTSHQIWIGGLFVLSMLLGGCQPEQLVNLTEKQSKVDVQVGDVETFKRVLEQQRGQIVVVDFWATWCGPCVTMFPHTVELANKFSADNVVVVAVSMDDPDEKANVREFLEKHNAQFENLLSSYGVGSAGFEAFEIPNGSIPHFRVYNQSGEVVFSSSSQEGLEARIKELIK